MKILLLPTILLLQFSLLARQIDTTNQMPAYGTHIPGINMLYAPWRLPHKPSGEQTACPFCKQFNEENDEQHFILKRYQHSIVMLNLYPYSAGHVLIIPFKHIGTLQELSPAELTELMLLIRQTSTILLQELKAEGINIGINIGKAAGASIPGHLHIHVVPRFLGDSGFLVSIAQTQVITNLYATYQTLLPAFQNVISYQ